ncbi:retrotransposon protein, putative, ty1-copia subclass [Tanacetum coccineum]
MGYSFYYPPENKVLVGRKADFLENSLITQEAMVFKKKTDMDGDVHTYKACLVAKGYTQTPRINYEETFSPVADIRAIRILISIAAYYDYDICKHQASGSNVTFLILYVDVILIMGNHIPMLQDVKYYLGMCFAMKDLGEAAYILGIKIYRDRSRRIPMPEKLRLSKSQGASTPAKLKRMKNVPYALAVGSIMYAVRYVGYLTDDDDLKSQTGYVFVLNRAIAIVNEFGITKGARHFLAKVHYLCEVIEFDDIKLVSCKSVMIIYLDNWDCKIIVFSDE